MKLPNIKTLDYEALIALHKQAGELIEARKESMRTKAFEDAAALLGKYGFSLEDMKSAKATNGAAHNGKANGARPRGAVSKKPCSVCGFKTEPPHDARSHRTQKKKKAFTAAEIAENGWKRA